jgi:lipopolysaccharide biosynthesis glycosyltransferase
MNGWMCGNEIDNEKKFSVNLSRLHGTRQKKKGSIRLTRGLPFVSGRISLEKGKSSVMKKYAIVTFIWGKEDYVGGANALAFSARKTETIADLVCLVTDDVPYEKLQGFNKIYRIKPIEMKEADLPLTTRNATHLYRNIREKICSKFKALYLEDYSKILLCDADLLFLQNIDDLFELSPPAGCFSHQFSPHFRKHPNYPEKLRNSFCTGRESLVFFPEYQHGETVPSTTLADVLSKPKSHGAQGGLLLLEPNKKLCAQYIAELPTLLASLPQPLFAGIDELTLTKFFHQQKQNWTNIGMDYNVIVLQLYNIFKEKSKVLHHVHYKGWKDETAEVAYKYCDQLEAHLLFKKYGQGIDLFDNKEYQKILADPLKYKKKSLEERIQKRKKEEEERETSPDVLPARKRIKSCIVKISSKKTTVAKRTKTRSKRASEN